MPFLQEHNLIFSATMSRNTVNSYEFIIINAIADHQNEDPASGTAESFAEPHFTLARVWIQGH